jgi:DNA-binding transcriptional ArsR family regulator
MEARQVAGGGAGEVRVGQRGKKIEESVTYAVGHRIRVEILILLNETSYTAAELADITGEPHNKIGNHLRELLDGGSIEVIEIRKRGNFDQHTYRAVETPYYSDDDIAAMPPYQRQVTYGLVIQMLMAEMMASFWANKIRDDPRSWIASNWLNLDAQGRQDLADEQQQSWQRLEKIELESLLRAAETGEETVSYVVGQVGFERARKAPKASTSADAD